MKTDLLPWLRDQLAKAEQSVAARDRMEQTMRGGTDASWKLAARATGTQYIPRKGRLERADRDKRIAAKCKRDVENFRAVIAIVEQEPH